MSSFQEITKLKTELISISPEDFFDKHIQGINTPHFDTERINFVSSILQEEFLIEIKENDLLVVGSSKIGFALHDKYKLGKKVGCAFRSFDDNSDIDLAICSPKLFSSLWHEISLSFSQIENMPHRQNNLGDYLTYGWLRTDQLKDYRGRTLIKCGKIRDVRAKIRKDRKKGHPLVDFGIFYDLEHLKTYQVRSISQCRQKLENPL